MMVKQGKFAKSSKLRQIKEIKRARQEKSDRTITEKQFGKFIFVRYGLTMKAKMIGTDKETMQRFLIEWVDHAPKDKNWSIKALAVNTLKKINVRVPYQFYRAVVRNWSKYQRFLKREIPAVPLKQRILLTDTLTTEEFEQLVARQLAANILLSTLGNNPQLMQQINLEQVADLSKNLMTENGKGIDWQKVQSVFKPMPFDMSTAPDTPTKNWLGHLLNEK
ncbi:hypothetical protein CLI91_02335 [Lentilactobacillus hilgardii]|nr:hypothetical protein [Lentilactobacillus hilgardii]MBZ2203242.1 hypothetical protein [Lentilactobacillus hilgardii]MCT3399985.1 hypothetical protein [Lentilactobacillus hilgardii]